MSQNTTPILHYSLPTRARTRRAPIPASCEADRPARAAWAALRLLVDVATSVRGDDGARAIDDVGGRRHGASYGVIDNRSENLQH